MARSAGYLLAAGATLTLALAPTSPGGSALRMLVTALVGYVLAVVVLASSERVPERSIPWLIAGGTMLVTLGIHFREAGTTAHALFYVWPVLYSCYFLRASTATFELAFALAAYGIVLGADGGAENRLETWLVVAVALAVTGALVFLLRSRVQRRLERLADAARTDVLTGLVNRRGFEELFDLELERARRAGTRLSVLVGDLDNFKQINDSFGHQTGDIALERASSVLEETKRRIDTAARLGGEEFALIAPDSDEHRAYMLAERLRGAIRGAFAQDPVPITISFGIACFPADGGTAAELLGAADQALYGAKELGRDRCVIYSGELAKVLSTTNGDGAGSRHLETVLALAETLDMRQGTATRHSQKVGRYAEMTARELGLPLRKVERVRLAGTLHDIGKIGVSDAVLSKPASLTDEEWAEIRRHPEIGARILGHAHLDDLTDWVLAHHERPDGHGFPLGRAGAEIPLEARILAVADAYEAMTSDRPYRSARSDEDAQAELLDGAGTQFDPHVVRAFLDSLKREGAAV
jgi:diguanylate cyclase (GGDEF)-like protein